MTTRTPLIRALLLALYCCASLPLLALAKAPTKSFNLPAGPADEALKSFITQSGVQLLYAPDEVKGVTTNAVQGDLTPDAAIDQLLSGTPLVAAHTKNGAIAVNRGEASPNAARAIAKNSGRPTSQTEKDEEKVLKLDTFEVMGTKLLNMDMPRSRDDVQPYVTFDREMIEHSEATNLDDFLKQRLTMNTRAGTGAQTFVSSGNVSSVNLRGLGANQTLILIDGHRASSFASNGAPIQSDINWIPLAAIQRIEVLPTTASGIFGGAATGGAVNIILRRNYNATEVKATYENTFSADAPLRRIDISSGFTLEDGKTSVLIAGSFSDTDTPAVRDRSFLADGRARLAANNPAALFNSTNPPLGATTNIRSTNGSNLVLKTGAALNASFTYVPVGYAGPASDGGTALIANAGLYNLKTANSEQFALGAGGLGLVGQTRVQSLLANVRRKFGTNLEAFLDMSMANNVLNLPLNFAPASYTLAVTAPTNPFTQSINITAPTNSSVDTIYPASNYDRRVVGGVVVRLPGEWQGEADFTWNQSRASFNNPQQPGPSLDTAITSGALNLIQDPNTINYLPYLGPPSTAFTPVRSRLLDAAVRLSGPVGTWAAGRPSLGALLEWRDERIASAYQTTSQGGVTAYNYRPAREQTVSSAYLEAKLPVFSAANRHFLLESLEFQLAGRLDAYRLHGAENFVNVSAPTIVPTYKQSLTTLHSVNPTIGLSYQPGKDITLRASMGTGFLPPTVSQLITLPGAAAAAPTTVIDPRRGNQPVTLPVPVPFTGGNPNLRPEKSDSWSAGLVWKPQALAGLRLSVDYTRIKKRDNIITPTAQQVVDNETYFLERVYRAAVVPGDPFTVGQITTVDITAVNLARAWVEAYDVALDYHWDTVSFGSFDPFFQATWQTHLQTQLAPSAPVLENVGITSTNPLKFKANAGITWKRHHWSATWVVQCFDSYYVANPTVPSSAPTILSQGNGGLIPRQFYNDVSLGYTFARRAPNSFASALLSGTEIRVGAKNVLNEAPPIDFSNTTKYYSLFGDPRMAGYFISVKHQF